jgi:hypothetical protein
LKTTYTDEAIADILDALTYLNERTPPPPRIGTPTSTVVRVARSLPLARTHWEPWIYSEDTGNTSFQT